MQKRLTLLYLFAWVTAGLISAAPAHSQNLLDRLEDRVRERLGGEQGPQPTGPQPTTPPNLQSPPLQPATAAPSADALAPGTPPTLGLEAEERGPGLPYEVVVNGVRPGTPAAQAELQRGDVILTADGRRVAAIEDISAVLQNKRIGDSLRLGIRRGDRQMEVQVTFAAVGNPPPSSQSPLPEQGSTEPNPRRPAVIERPPSGSGRIGVTVENASTTPPGAGVPVRRGAVVVAVVPGSPADVLGIRPGNVIVAIDGRVIQNAAGLIEEIGATVPGQQIEISFYRGESLMRMPLRLADADGLAAGPAPGEARLGPPTGAGPLAAGPASSPPTGLLGGLGQAIGGMFGAAAAPPAVAPGVAAPNVSSREADPDDLGSPPAVAPPSETERPAFSAPPGSAADTTAGPEPGASPLLPAGPLTPVAPAEPTSPLAPPAGSIAAPPMESPAAPPAETSTEQEPADAELVPLPAEGPDEFRQLTDRLQAMQQRIDVLERRLAELEAERREISSDAGR